MNKNIVPQTYSVTREDRSRLLGHEPLLLWFTGLSGSGKSTIANGVERALHRENVKTYVLDGDNVRGGINNDLSFSSEDRTENIRRIAEVSKLMLDAGLVVLATFVSPYRNDRDAVKQAVGYTNMVEIFVNTPIAECERRDVKGLYARARAGEISNFTGIDAPYEAPVAADIQINTVEMDVPAAVAYIISEIKSKVWKPQLNKE